MNQDERNFYETMKARDVRFSSDQEMMREIDSRAASIIRDQNPTPRVSPARQEFNSPEEATAGIGQAAIESSAASGAVTTDDATMSFSIDPQSVNVDMSSTGKEIVFGKTPEGEQITLGYLAANPQMVTPRGAPDPGLQPPTGDPSVAPGKGQPPAKEAVQGAANFAGGIVKGLALGMSEAGGVVAKAAGIQEELEEFGAFMEDTFGIPRTIPVNINGTAEETGQAFGRFGAVFVPAARVAKMLGAGLFVRGMVAGAVSDFSAFPADEPNIGDVAKQFQGVNPEIASGLRQLMIDTMAKDIGADGIMVDGEFEARLKNSFGGLMAGAAIDSTVFMYRMARRVLSQPENMKSLIVRGLDGERRLQSLAEARSTGTGGLTSQEIATKEIEAMNDILMGQVGSFANDMEDSLNQRLLRPLLNERGAIGLSPDLMKKLRAVPEDFDMDLVIDARTATEQRVDFNLKRAIKKEAVGFGQKTFYHGTIQGEIKAFNRKAQDPAALYGKGFYFTDSPKIAGGAEGDRIVGYANQKKPGAIIRGRPILKISEPLGFIDEELARVEKALEKQGLVKGRDYFTVNKELSNGDLEVTVLEAKTSAPTVYPVNLKADRPFEVDFGLSEKDIDPLIQGINKTGTLTAERDVNGMIVRSASGGNIIWEWAETQDMQEIYFELRKMMGGEATTQILKDSGFDSIKHIGGGITGNNDHNVTIVFEPEQIRSVFAEFNPEKSKSGNILAAGVPGAALVANKNKDKKK